MSDISNTVERNLPKNVTGKDPINNEQSLFVKQEDGRYKRQGTESIYEIEEILKHNDYMISTDLPKSSPSCSGPAYLTNVGGGSYDREE